MGEVGSGQDPFWSPAGAGPASCEPNRPKCPREDSNLRTRLRRPVLYPLSYEGGHVRAGRMVEAG
jgi:hypothetical protein